MLVAENTQYRGTQILIGKMSDLNTSTWVASKAWDISAFATTFTASTKPQKESVELMANAGQQAADITGNSKFTGTLDINLATGLLLPLVSGTIGSSTQAALTASLWTTATVTAVGDIVKLSTGEYLVAQSILGDATTGAVAPSIVDKDDYDDLTIDGTDASNGVIWKLRDMLYNSPLHKTGFCTEKFFIIERAGEGCGSSNIFDTIALNVELTSFKIEKADGILSQKQSIPFLATNISRSSNATYNDITVTLPVVPREFLYKAEDITIRVNGAKYGTLHNFMLEYSRQVTTKDSSEPNEQIMIVNSPTFTGSGTIELDPAEYAVLQASSKKAVTVTFDHRDGEKMLITLPSVVFDEPDVVLNGNEPRLLSMVLKPTGNATIPMGTFDITTATQW